VFTLLQKSAGAARDEITEAGMIDQPCYEQRADSAEAAKEMI
jgi:hypothetical protein